MWARHPPLLPESGGHREAFKAKNMPLYSHLRRRGHSFTDLKATILEKVRPPTTKSLLEAEEKWINTLNTCLPHGLNSIYPSWEAPPTSREVPGLYNCSQ